MTPSTRSAVDEAATALATPPVDLAARRAEAAIAAQRERLARLCRELREDVAPQPPEAA